MEVYKTWYILYTKRNKETRNKYIIYAYYTPVWRKYDRIVGITKNTSNSLYYVTESKL